MNVCTRAGAAEICNRCIVAVNRHHMIPSKCTNCGGA